MAKTTMNNDIIIATYMGWEQGDQPGTYVRPVGASLEWIEEDMFGYSTSWDALIPVLVKCGMVIVDISDITKVYQNVIQRIRDLETNTSI